MAGFVLLVAYLVSLILGYSVFVRLRSRSRNSSDALSFSWFPGSEQRKAYYDSYNSFPDELSQDSVKTLRTLLLRRAMEDVARLISLREDRQPLANLLARGAISDSMWSEYIAAETDLDAEIGACMQDADELQPEWGRSIMQQAAQLHQREREVLFAERRRRAEQASFVDTPEMQRIRDELARELELSERREKSKRGGASRSNSGSGLKKKPSPKKA